MALGRGGTVVASRIAVDSEQTVRLDRDRTGLMTVTHSLGMDLESYRVDLETMSELISQLWYFHLLTQWGRQKPTGTFTLKFNASHMEELPVL